MRKSWSLRDHGGFLATIVDLQGEEAVKKGVQIKSSGKYSLKGEKRREKEKEEGEGGKRREKERLFSSPQMVECVHHLLFERDGERLVHDRLHFRCELADLPKHTNTHSHTSENTSLMGGVLGREREGGRGERLQKIRTSLLLLSPVEPGIMPKDKKVKEMSLHKG